MIITQNVPFGTKQDGLLKNRAQKKPNSDVSYILKNIAEFFLRVGLKTGSTFPKKGCEQVAPEALPSGAPGIYGNPIEFL